MYISLRYKGSCCQHALKFKRTNQSWGWNYLASGRCLQHVHEHLRKAEEANFRAKFWFFTSLSAAEARVFGVKFIGLYGTVVFIAIRDFSCWGESDLWSDVWPAMDGVVCLSILLEGRVADRRFQITSLNGVGMTLKSAQETSRPHIWGRKTLFEMR